MLRAKGERQRVRNGSGIPGHLQNSFKAQVRSPAGPGSPRHLPAGQKDGQELQSSAGPRLARRRHAEAPSLSFPSQWTRSVQMFGGFLSSNLTHLFPLHETLLLLQVDVVYGEALLCTRLEHDGAIRSANHPALPPRHLHVPQAEREALSSRPDLHGRSESHFSTAFSAFEEGEETSSSRNPLC